MNKQILSQLMSNWGDKAECMACFAEARFYDPLSGWACYLLAVNPADEDEIVCIIDGYYVELCHWSLKEVCGKYNFNGEYVIFDTAFRRQRAAELFKKLWQRKDNGIRENKSA